LNQDEKTTALKLLELQRHAMLMYTSCGWFFDDLSGIETVQVIQYAGRAIQLASVLLGDQFESRFLALLERAKSNVPEYRDGRNLYEKWVKPSVVDWETVGAHYAISSLFKEYAEQTKIYCFTVDRQDYQTFAAGKARLVVGRAKLTSEITRESAEVSFGVLHFGDHNVNGGVRVFEGEEAYRSLTSEVTEPFSRADFAEVIRILDRQFGESTYSLRSLFRDEQRKAANLILETSLAEAETVYRQIYENHAPMMRFLTSLNMPLPRAFHAAAELVLNAQLRQALESGDFDLERIKTLLEAARFEGVPLAEGTLTFALKQSMERVADEILSNPSDLTLIERLRSATTLARSLPFEVNLWKVQNRFYEILESAYPGFQEMAGQGDEASRTWLDDFVALGEALSVQVAQQREPKTDP
jgi:hypothetical protein